MSQINEIKKRDNTNQIVPGKWERKALMVGENLLVAEDHNGAISGTVEFNADVAGHCIANKCRPFAGDPGDPIHVVAHTRNAVRSRAGFFTSLPSSPPRLIILHASSVGPVEAESESSTADGIGCVWLSVKDRAAYCSKPNLWLSEFLKLTYGQAEQLAGFKTRAESGEWEAANPGFEHFLDIILPGRIENLLAFRLLCEATKAVGKANIERKIKGEATANTIDLSGITIRAPATLDEWLKPFAKTEQVLPTIEQMAVQIASGPVKTEVENVLRAVGDTENLIVAIDKFEQEFAKHQAALKAGSKP